MEVVETTLCCWSPDEGAAIVVTAGKPSGAVRVGLGTVMECTCVGVEDWREKGVERGGSMVEVELLFNTVDRRERGRA